MQLFNITYHISNSYENDIFQQLYNMKNLNMDFFSFLLYRNEDLKQMLESNKDSAKLDAMKRIVGVSKIDDHFDFWKMNTQCIKYTY